MSLNRGISYTDCPTQSAQITGSRQADCGRQKSLARTKAGTMLLAAALLCGSIAGAQPYLILHDLPHAAATPDFLSANRGYIDTLPIDGIFVYARGTPGNITADTMRPSPVSLSSIQQVFAPLRGLTWRTMKQNFGLVYYGPGWADVYDDAKWAIVTQNMANYARAAREAGLIGVAFDNENYSSYGTYGDLTCRSPYTRAQCQAKMQQRGNQIMRAMMAEFPNMEILFFMDPTMSDKTFFQQPQFRYVNDVSHANLLVGPFVVGFAEASVGSSAKVILGAENPGFEAKTPESINDIYQYLKHGLVNDALHPTDSESRAAGANGFIPRSLRASWPNVVSAGMAVYNINNMDARNNMPTTLQSTITNALNRADKYVWLYMEVWSAAANPPHPTLLIPPGSAANAAPQAFVDAVRAGRAAAQSGSTTLTVSSVTAGSVTSSSAVITWTTNTTSDSVVDYGTSTSYGQSASTPGMVTQHAVTLSGLSAGTTYNYRVRSTDSVGRTATSGNVTFATPAGSTNPAPVPSPSPGASYISDRTPTSSTNGYGPVEKDRSNGENGAGDGRALSIRGVTYAKGLGVHAPSDVRYNLAGACSSFTATVGVDDEVAPNGSVVFQVWADGAKVYDSGVVTAAVAGRPVSVNIAGRNELRLVVTDGGNGIGYDHGDWANAQVTCGTSSGSSSYLSDRTPTHSTNGFGPVEKDKSNGEAGAGDGRTLSIRGVTYAKGLGVHAPSDVRYNLGGACSSFSAVVGIDDEMAPYGSVVFQVWADGAKLYDSGVVTAAVAGRPVSVNIAGRNELRLVVTDGGNGVDFDHADWANAQVTCGTSSGSSSYLSDRTPTHSTNGFGPVEKDKSNGEAGAGDGRTLSIRGVTYAKGLGVHAPSDVRYNVAGRCSSFSAVVGIDDEMAPHGSVVFQVWADGAKLYDSGVVTAAAAGRPVSVNIAGRNELRLVVTDGGNGVDFDHANWADAQVTCQ